MSDLSTGPLAALQSRIQAYVLDAAPDGQPVLALLQGRANGRPDDAKGGRPKAAIDTAGRGLAIYHSAYRSRLREALGAVYERTWAYLGDDEFDALCARHIEAERSSSRNLRDYGSAFPALLHRALPDDPEVAELATMDWKLHLAFDAPDTTALTATQLSALDESDWAQARLAFQPAMSLAVFEWNVLEVWHALDHGLEPPAVRRLPAPIAHLFWRSEQRARFRTLAPDEHAALQGLGQGVRFAEVCERIARDHPDAGERIGGWLGRWLADALIRTIERDPEP